jgi:hypothetical protein
MGAREGAHGTTDEAGRNVTRRLVVSSSRLSDSANGAIEQAVVMGDAVTR